MRAIYRDDDQYEYRSDPSDSTTVSVPNYLKPDNFSSEVSGGDIELEWDAPTISWNANRHGLDGLPAHDHDAQRQQVHDSQPRYRHYFIHVRTRAQDGTYTFQLVAIYFIFSSGFDSTLESIGGQ